MTWQEILNWALGVIATLFGGLNIFQWITLKSYKRVKAAEADRQEIENLKTTIETIQESMDKEINRLNKRVEDAEKRANEAEKRASDAEKRASEDASKYLSLFEKHDALRTEFENYKSTHK